MKGTGVLAYTYEADYHCERCARERFPESDEWPGIDADGNELTDSEGNAVGAVFAVDEWYDIGEGDQELHCGTCGALLDTYEED